MRERDLQGAGLVVSALMLAALVVGTAWRAADAGSGRDSSPAQSETGGTAGAEVRTVRHIEVPPGWRAEQTAQALERAGIGSAERFLRLVHDPGRARLGRRWAKLPSLEGYLHPGVYDVDGDTTESGLVEEMVARFDQSLTGAMRRRARALGLSVHEVVTLASIVQREMSAPSEAPVISAVFHNRLRRGIELKANPTLVYALDSARETSPDGYWVGGGYLSREEVSFDSPYNTYARKGLPPGPIASPGLDALEAALYPADLDHLFFVAKGNGFHEFARTGREHVANVARYRPGAVPKRQRRSELERLVRRLLSSFEGHVGVVVKDLTTGETVSVNADEYFTTASLYKLPVLWAAFDARERGRLSFARRLPIPQHALLQDTPDIQRRLGRRPTLAKAVTEMIAVSSNGAGVTLLSELGRESIDRLLRRHGVSHTSLSSLRMVTTPRDIARVLELMARGRAVSTRASAEMVRILGGQEIRDRLPRLLPEAARLAHKTGELDFTRHDAGILFTRRGPVVVVALTEDANPARASETIAYFGRLVFNYFERYRPLADRLKSGRNPACPASPFRARVRGPLSGKKIVLDPGHGGRDPGAIFAFPDGFVLKEKDVTLDVSLRLRDRLLGLGATVHLTRCRDVLPSVYARAALANAAVGDVVLSVHVNGSPSPSRDGTEVYYFLPDGKALADHLLGTFARPAIWETLSERLPLPNHGLHRRSLGLLTTTFAPTALTESLFMTHPAEAAALRARGPRSRRAKVVRGHVLGLLSYFGARKPVLARKSMRARESSPSVGRKEITVAATGDVALGSTPALPLHGPEGLFDAVDGHLAGDLVLGNLETALALEGKSKCAAGGGANCFAFRAPPWYAYWLKQAGFTAFSLANNHNFDFGPEGAAETILALDEAGLAHTGRPGQVLRREISGVRVAVVGFAPYRAAQNLLDLPEAQRLVRRADEWADVVIVAMHAGAEGSDRTHVPDHPETFLGEPRGDPRAFARAVVHAGADLVVGHGPHVLRGMAWYRGRLIAYSLGNFAGYGNFALDGDLGVSGVLQATLRADGSWKRGRLLPLRLADGGTPRPDPSARGVELVRTLSREDFRRPCRPHGRARRDRAAARRRRRTSGEAAAMAPPSRPAARPPVRDRGHGRPARSPSDRTPRLRARHRGVRLPAHARPHPADRPPRRARPLSRGDADRRRPSFGFPPLQRPDRARRCDRLGRLGRLLDGVEPLAGPGAAGSEHDDAGPRPRRRRPRRHGAIGARGPVDPDPRSSRDAGRLPRLYAGKEPRFSLVGQHHLPAEDRGGRAAGAPPRRRSRRRQLALGGGVRPHPDERAVDAGEGAGRPAGGGRGRRAACARRPAHPQAIRAIRRIRPGQPPLEPEPGVLRGRRSGRPDRRDSRASSGTAGHRHRGRLHPHARPPPGLCRRAGGAPLRRAGRGRAGRHCRGRGASSLLRTHGPGRRTGRGRTADPTSYSGSVEDARPHPAREGRPARGLRTPGSAGRP